MFGSRFDDVAVVIMGVAREPRVVVKLVTFLEKLPKLARVERELPPPRKTETPVAAREMPVGAGQD